MGRLYFMADGDGMVRRRARIPKGSVVEAWADRRGGGAFWVGEESKRLLDEAGEAPMPARLSVPDDGVPVFHRRRPGGGAGHVWRRFETKREAIDFMREAYGAESEGIEWAETLPVGDFDALLKRFSEKGG